MPKYFSYLSGSIICILLIIETLLIFRVKSLNTKTYELNKLLINCETNFINSKMELEQTIQDVTYYLDISNDKLNNIIVKKIQGTSMLRNSAYFQDDLVPFHSLLNNRKLIFRFFHTNCSSCIKEQMDKLNILSKTIGQDKILLVTDYLHSNIKWYLLENNINFNIYLTENNKLTPFFDDKMVAYIFISDINKKICSPFIIDESTIRLTDKFYARDFEKLLN